MRRNSKAQGTLSLLKGHEGCMTLVAFVSDDHIISASDQDRTIRRWSFSDSHWTNELLKEAMAICAVATSPDRRWVAYGGADGRVRLIDLETRKITKSDERHAGMVQSVSFSPDSTQLASGARDGTLLLWSLNPLQPAAEPFKRHTDSVWCIRYSPDGRKIASCDRQVIQIRDFATRAKLPITEQAWSLAWSTSDESCFLLAGCIDGTLRRFDPDTGETLTICKAHHDVIFSIALPHSANFIATASWDKTVRFWEATTFQEIAPCLQHDVNVHSISISPSDKYLVSGARDPTVRVWNLRVIAPALFGPILLQPVRPPQKSGFHLPFRQVHFATEPSPTSPHPPDASSRIASKNSQESLQKSDGENMESKKPSKPRLSISYLRKKKSKVDGLRTPSLSSQESNHSDREMRSSPSSYHSAEQSIFLSPGGPSRNLPATTLSLSPRVNDSESVNVIRRIRSHPVDLSGKIIPEGNDPVSGGSHGDIYRGMLNVDGSTMRVAIKVIKKYTAQGDDESKKRRLRREIELWRTLEHRNVIPLLGTSTDYGAFEAMVCPWVENGALGAYLESHKNELTEQQRFGIINDVALGLQYLHLRPIRPIVHGDISGTNVLIDESGRACIADFGLSIVLTDLQGSSMALTYQLKGTLRYTAPELLFGILEPGRDSDSTNSIPNENATKVFPTVQSDIYSFGSIMLQTLTGKVPYHYLVDGTVILNISQGEYPRRPKSSVVTDAQWEFMIRCWSFEPMDRPPDADIVTFVHEQLINAVAHCESPSRRRRETGRSDESHQS
ncbi:WD40-repeat-containing domain protein [Chiua virens]|nr:WD40-repeat-containing domain protein [Chiua virens]